MEEKFNACSECNKVGNNICQKCGDMYCSAHVFNHRCNERYNFRPKKRLSYSSSLDRELSPVAPARPVMKRKISEPVVSNDLSTLDFLAQMIHRACIDSRFSSQSTTVVILTRDGKLYCISQKLLPEQYIRRKLEELREDYNLEIEYIRSTVDEFNVRSNEHFHAECIAFRGWLIKKYKKIFAIGVSKDICERCAHLLNLEDIVYTRQVMDPTTNWRRPDARTEYKLPPSSRDQLPYHVERNKGYPSSSDEGTPPRSRSPSSSPSSREEFCVICKAKNGNPICEECLRGSFSSRLAPKGTHFQNSFRAASPQIVNVYWQRHVTIPNGDCLFAAVANGIIGRNAHDLRDALINYYRAEGRRLRANELELGSGRERWGDGEDVAALSSILGRRIIVHRPNNPIVDIYNNDPNPLLATNQAASDYRRTQNLDDIHIYFNGVDHYEAMSSLEEEKR